MASTAKRNASGSAEQGRDVPEDDAGRREVGDVPDVLRRARRRQPPSDRGYRRDSLPVEPSSGRGVRPRRRAQRRRFLRGRGAWVSAAGCRAPCGRPPAGRREPVRRRRSPASATAGQRHAGRSAGRAARADARRGRRRQPLADRAGTSGSRSLRIGQDRRGDEDRRVGAGEQADQQGEREVLQGDGAEHPRPDDQQREHRQHRGEAGVERAHQHLVHRQVHDVGVGGAGVPSRLAFSWTLSNTTMVSYREKPRMVRKAIDRRRRDLEPEDRVDADADEHVVEDGERGAPTAIFHSKRIEM